MINRKVKGKIKSTTTLKDVNLLKAKKQNKNLTLFDPVDREKLRSIISKDVEFLRKQGLMDYSLLLAIEKE